MTTIDEKLAVETIIDYLQPYSTIVFNVRSLGYDVNGNRRYEYSIYVINQSYDTYPQLYNITRQVSQILTFLKFTKNHKIRSSDTAKEIYNTLVGYIINYTGKMSSYLVDFTTIE